MNTTPWSLGLAAAIAAIALTVLVWMPSLAVAGDKLTVTVTLPDSTPAPSGTDVEFIDGSGPPRLICCSTADRCSATR